MTSGHEEEGDPDGDEGGERVDPALRRLARLYRRRAERVRGWVGGVVPRRQNLRADVLAGLPGAISSVPDGMAASVLAGVPPTHGLYACFAGPVAGGLTTSTRLMVVTTTSAAALAAGSAIATVPPEQRSDAVVWLTLVAGGLMLLAAAVGLSRYTRFVSHSVMLGFLTGVAVNMVLGQLPDLLGVERPRGDLAISRAVDAVVHPRGVDPHSAVAGVAALVILAVLGRTRIAVVSSLVALAAPTAAVVLLDWSEVARVADGGALPRGIPLPQLPSLAALDLSIVTAAASVAVIILVQGAGVAQAVGNLDGSRSSARRDFTAQGVANLASGLFAGQPVGGSVGQTALNVSAGARSRWAAIASGLWMLAILLAFSPIVGQVATPTLAAVLVHAGWGTVRPADIASMVRAGRIPAIALVSTFLAVLVLPVAVAVGVGVTASLLLQLNQESLDLRVVRRVPLPGGGFREEPAPSVLTSREVVVLDVYGSMFFAGAQTLRHQLPEPSGSRGAVVVLRVRGRTTLGSTFLGVIGEYHRRLLRNDGALYLSGVDPQLARRWGRDGLAEAMGGIRLFEATDVVGEATSSAVREGLREAALGKALRVATAPFTRNR